MSEPLVSTLISHTPFSEGYCSRSSMLSMSYMEWICSSCKSKKGDNSQFSRQNVNVK